MSEAERDRVAAAALGWLRTPYHRNARVKGHGVDCAMLPAAVYEEAGVIEHIEPEYPSDWHLHRSEELYLGWIDRVGGVEIEIAQACKGDFLVWRFGRTFSHGAIVLDPPQIVHAFAEAGMVTLDSWPDVEELVRRPMKAFTFWGRN